MMLHTIVNQFSVFIFDKKSKMVRIEFRVLSLRTKLIKRS